MQITKKKQKRTTGLTFSHKKIDRSISPSPKPPFKSHKHSLNAPQLSLASWEICVKGQLPIFNKLSKLFFKNINNSVKCHGHINTSKIVIMNASQSEKAKLFTAVDVSFMLTGLAAEQQLCAVSKLYPATSCLIHF